MLPRADLGVTAIARTEAVVRTDTIGDARHEAFQRTMAGLLGQSLQGKIVSKLTDGSYLVELAGANARMLLPAGTQVGTQVPMTLVSLTPRPTFQVATPGAPPGAPPGTAGMVHAEAFPTTTPPGAASSLAVPPDLAQARAGIAAQAGPGAPPLPGQQPGVPVQPGALQTAAAQSAVLAGRLATAGGALAEGASSSVQTILSPTAKVLGQVLSLAMSTPGTPNGIVAAAPLVPTPGAAPAQLAAALRDSVGRSGLFYESHVAEWAAGNRSLAELATEPQMQRAFAGAVPTEDSTAAQLINLQLQTQEQAKVVWQGQAWPGQEMQWEVQRDERDGNARPDGEPAEPGWRSKLHLRFPLLGEIGARLYMSGDQVHLQLDAGDSRVGELLRERSGELGAAMAAAGIDLSSFNIRAAPADGEEQP